jgi:hypothetical protein
MQKIPALLKSRHTKAEVSSKAIGTEIKKVVKRQICALLTQKSSVELLYTHVDNDTCGQE